MILKKPSYKLQEDVLVFLEMPYGMTPGVSFSIISDAARGDEGHRAFTLVLIR